MTRIEAAYDEFKRGRVGEAERICRHILASAAGDLEANWLLCDLLSHTGRADLVEPTARAALAANPNEPDLLRLHGEALARLGRTEEAIGRLTQAIDRRLIFPKAHEALSTLLARCNDPTPRFSASVITPTIGMPQLSQAIASVQAQQYPLVDHILFVDGPQHETAVRNLIPAQPRHPIHLLHLPFNVGGDHFNGHRVYGAAPFLVNGNFVAYLDEDNWFEPDHLGSLMAKVTAAGLCWAYALRKIVTPQGEYVVNDDCESLGQWPVWYRTDAHHVDTNCYLLRRDVALATSAAWYRRAFDVYSPDRALCRQLLRDWPRCGTNGRYTVNYRVEMTEKSATAKFFQEGNAAMQKRYADGFPWRQSAD
jgi:hypothetical protein